MGSIPITSSTGRAEGSSPDGSVGGVVRLRRRVRVESVSFG